MKGLEEFLDLHSIDGRDGRKVLLEFFEGEDTHALPEVVQDLFLFGLRRQVLGRLQWSTSCFADFAELLTMLLLGSPARSSSGFLFLRCGCRVDVGYGVVMVLIRDGGGRIHFRLVRLSPPVTNLYLHFCNPTI